MEDNPLPKVQRLMDYLHLHPDEPWYKYSRYIDAKEPIGSKLFFLSPIRSRKGAYQLKKTCLAIDSDIKR